jgi:hypothetical protein
MRPIPEYECPCGCRSIETEHLFISSTFLNSCLKERPFHGARFPITKNLILTTALHETSADLEIYRPIITEALKFIGPAVAKISEPWTKFILHGVPTY